MPELHFFPLNDLRVSLFRKNPHETGDVWNNVNLFAPKLATKRILTPVNANRAKRKVLWREMGPRKLEMLPIDVQAGLRRRFRIVHFGRYRFSIWTDHQPGFASSLPTEIGIGIVEAMQ